MRVIQPAPFTPPSTTFRSKIPSSVPPFGDSVYEQEIVDLVEVPLVEKHGVDRSQPVRPVLRLHAEVDVPGEEDAGEGGADGEAHQHPFHGRVVMRRARRARRRRGRLPCRSRRPAQASVPKPCMKPFSPNTLGMPIQPARRLEPPARIISGTVIDLGDSWI